MKHKNSTKRTLALSLLVMLLCVAMLVGTTFAWFTDSASSSGNKIQAGTLNIDLLVKNARGEYESVKDSQDAIFNYDKWEPGYTEVRNVKVKTTGTLALKYTLSIVPKSSTTPANLKLAEVIDVYYASREVNVENRDLTGLTRIGTLKDVLNGAEGTIINDTLIPDQNTEDYATIVLKMQESAGNDYQGLSVGDGFDLNLVATQYTYESDSFNNQYDENAQYPVIGANELKTALAAGGVVAINNDITADVTKTAVADRITVNAPTTLNLDAKIIVPGELEPSDNWAGLYIADDTVLNATENGGIQCLNKANGECGTYVAHIKDGANVTVNGGTYHGGGTIFNVQTGTLTINGGHFEVTPFGDPYYYNFLLNCVDANYRNGTAKIIVKGGTFVNFNPSNNSAEGAGTNFVADGYTVVSEAQSNGDIWYTVVPA